jgi:hypothetical protein
MNKITLYLLLCMATLASNAQTVAINPTGDGGFELGSTFAVNNWLVVPGSSNNWAVGTGSIYAGVTGAYIGDATTYVGTSPGGAASVSHFFRDVTIPTGATNVQLSFLYKQPVADFGFDSFYVAATTTAFTPLANVSLGVGYTKLYYNTATMYPSYTTITLNLSAYAGTTVRLVFSHRNDNANPIGVPAVDNISLTYCDPAISGALLVCTGNTTTLSNTAATGAWTSSNPAVASVGASTGVITGVTAGTAGITFTTGTCPAATRVVTVNPLPTAFAVSGGGAYCPGGATLSISLSNSSTGVNYQLYNGTSLVGTPLSGTGSGLTFSGLSGIGSYSIRATNVTTGCSFGMSGTATITSSLPNAYTVTGGGNYCIGGAGVAIGLSGSSVGSTYQLFSGTTPIGSAVSGTGGAISFGTISSVGTYTVMGTNIAASCSGAMTGSASVALLPTVTPSVSIAPGVTGLLCSGTMVSFMATPVNGGSSPTYQWTVNGSIVGAGGSYAYIPADGDVVEVVLTATPGGCTSPGTASVSYTTTVTPTQLPVVTAMATPGTHVCAGSIVHFTTTPAFGGTAPTYKWSRNGVYVATGSTFYCGTLTNGDVIRCLMFSNYQCRTADSVYSSPQVMNIEIATAAPTVAIMTKPGITVTTAQPDTFIAIAAGGTASLQYQWFVNSSAVTGATNPMFISSTLANGDMVSCKVTNTDFCAANTTKFVAITVLPAGIHDLQQEHTIFISPNPSNGIFNLRGTTSAENISMTVTDLMGRMVHHEVLGASNYVLNADVNLGNNVPGLYIITIESTDGIQVLRCIIE